MRRPFFPILGILSLWAASAGAETPPPASEAAGTGEPGYVYKADKMRDPFIPLVGQGMAEFVPASSSTEGDFSPETVELKGMLKTKSGRWAVLRATGGATFLVKEGKILDSKRKAVVGYVGIVKEKSLVLIGPDNKVTELKLKKDMEPNTP
ncbi:MAG: hypothetical protein HY548_01990 [Elusimicrobia bacterium]|nr:hypothetical protein [Elusimicrobiota bacterium]